MSYSQNLLISRFKEILLSQSDDDSSHGLAHIYRVWKNVLGILNLLDENDKARVDMEILTAATFLHDIINLSKNHPERNKASTLSAAKASEILQKESFPKEKISAVAHAIMAHSFSANIFPETLEAQILQDADRIDAIGAIGVARCFYVAGKMGTELYETHDPLASKRELNDMKYALDHFENKLFKLSNTMKTTAGKNWALKRTEVMKDFLEQLKNEIL